jgi:hypothetical protein
VKKENDKYFPGIKHLKIRLRREKSLDIKKG